MKIHEYLTSEGKSPFKDWFSTLDARAAAKMTVALTRLASGNTSNVKSVSSGVYEYKIDFGPGYRIYFAYDGPHLVILLAGGTKKRQRLDVSTARERWNDFKQRKKTQKGG